MQPDDYRISEGGVMVWKCPELHPLLSKTDTDHPDLLRKASEVFPKGQVGGLPKICSENSKDACTWFYFLVLQFGDYPTNAREFVHRYSQRPNDIKEKLYYRHDLSEEDFDFLSKSIGYVCWPDPLSWDRVLGIPRR